MNNEIILFLALKAREEFSHTNKHHEIHNISGRLQTTKAFFYLWCHLIKQVDDLISNTKENTCPPCQARE